MAPWTLLLPGGLQHFFVVKIDGSTMIKENFDHGQWSHNPAAHDSAVSPSLSIQIYSNILIEKVIDNPNITNFPLRENNGVL